MKTRSLSPHRLPSRLVRPRRKGVIIVLCAFLIQAMFAFCALAIDLGFIVLTSQQLQNAADAAALAAVLELKSAAAGDTVEVLKQRALEQATLAGSLNRAATRPVVIGASDVEFGDRSFNTATGRFETEYGADLAHVNSVRVDIAFDGDGVPAGYTGTDWVPRDGRQELELFFGRVIDVPTTIVRATSAANLAPRDLVFCIDISGSMFGQSGGNTNRRGETILPLLMDQIYSGAATTWPLQWYDPAHYKGNYQRLWNESMVNGTFGTPAQTAAFLAQEFPDRNPATPWTHWKWRAFCDWNFASLGGGFNTVESARVYNGNGETKNINVSMTANAKTGFGGGGTNINGRSLFPRPTTATPLKNPPALGTYSATGAHFGP
ncbi:MAG TPA: pilus assembly protein TadG-related protein, partial [Pirellulales bacterium]